MENDSIGNMERSSIGNMESDSIGNMKSDSIGNMESNSIGNTKKGTEKDDDDDKRKTKKRNVHSIIERHAKESASNTVGVKVEDLVGNEISKEKKQDLSLTIDSDDNDAKLYNTRALTKNAPTYELENFEKKALIIFNHKHFRGKRHKTRLGTEHDVKALRNTFEKCGFDVVEHKDLTKKQVFKELKTFSMTDFTDYGCVAIAVLTHGKEDKLRAWDQAYYSEVEILQYFNISDKPSLVTKPRILIVQACRGVDPLDGVEVQPAETTQVDDDSDEEPYYLPKESDLLILHSSYRGKPSYRDALEGSWFIQSLCKKVDELAATHDLESIVTEVKREVAVDKVHQEFNIETLKLEYNKQMPEVTTTLIRKLYLKKYGDAAPPNLPELFNASSVQNPPLQLQLSTDFDHFSYTWNCLRLTDWMSTTETSLQTEDHSEEDLLRMSLEVEELRGVLNNINLIGPQLFKTSTGEGTMPIEGILTRHNRRFDAIAERVQAISNNQGVQENLDKTEEKNPTSSAINEIIEKNLQEFETKFLPISDSEEIVKEMKKLLSWLQYCSDSINKLVLDTNDRQTVELEQAKLKFIMMDIARYQSRLNALDEAAKQMLTGIEGTKQASEIVETLATLNDKCDKLQEQVRQRQKEIAEAFKKCAPKLKQKLEEAVKLEESVTEFREALQSFCEFLESSEKTLESAQPVSVVVETIDVQIQEHSLIVKEVRNHYNTLLSLSKSTQFSQVRETITWRKSLSLSLQPRLGLFFKAMRLRTTALNNGYKEANNFRNMWNELMNWLHDAEKQLRNIDPEISVKDGFEKRFIRTKKISEFEKELDAKKGVYNQVLETGNDLMQKAPKTDERTLQTMLSDMKAKWELLNSKAAEDEDTEMPDYVALTNYMYMLNQNH